jgi:SAM-dependent methyltransferase
MSTPTTEAFREALQEYRKKWSKDDGYYNVQQRFVQTYALLRSFYTGGQVLDVGGWPGDFACTLAMLRFDVLLLDKDPTRPTAKRLQETGEYALGGGTTLVDKCKFHGVKALTCDIERERLPLPDAAAPYIVFTEVIEHLYVGLLHTLRELHRVLQPGGRLLLSTPNLLSLRNRLSFLAGTACYDTLAMPYDALAAAERIGHSGHFRVFSMPELVDLLHKTGFQVLYQTYQQIPWADMEKPPLSLYSIKEGGWNWFCRMFKSLGNTLFLVVTRRAENS